MLIAAVTHLVDGLSLETLLTLKVGKVSNLLNEYTETKSLCNRTTVNVALANVNETYSVKFLSSGIKRFQI
jgi:hypothetical protein